MLEIFSTLIDVYLKKNLVINFSAIETCNARCSMCNIWKNNIGFDIEPSSIALFESSLKLQTKHIGISGGEPFLRSDLKELVTEILNNFVNLQSLSITSHGFQEQRIRQHLKEISDLCRGRSVSFSINFSVDGDQESHDRQRGVPGGYVKVLRSATYARELEIPTQLQFTATSDNVYSAPHVLFLANNIGASVVFRVATNITRLGQEQRDVVALDMSERSYFADFLSSDKVMQVSSITRRIYYRWLCKYLIKGQNFDRLCLFKQNGLYVDGKRNMYPCSLSSSSIGRISEHSIDKATAKKVRKELVDTKCMNCIHDQSFIPSWKDYLKEVFYKASSRLKLTRITFFSTVVLHAIKSYFGDATPAKDNVLIIGQYGGEHVGDSAILGGVLQSLPKNCKVDVVSIRPDRTRFWLTGLINITQKVSVVSISDAFRDIKKYDKIVFGGGPIMWLPTILAYHYALLLVSNQRAAVEIIGCGVIDSNSSIFRYIVKKILTRADRLDFRSEYSLKFCHELDIKGAKLIDDPAVTYMLRNYDKD